MPRPSYLKRLAPYGDGELIKVLLGQRRVGKSGLLRLLWKDWVALHPERAHLLIDKELEEWRYIRTGADLLAAARNLASPGNARSLLLVDEIQEIEGFAAALRSLAAEGRHDIYVTGSNARLLSGELATLFAGRTVTIPVHSLSYGEFLLFHGIQDSDESFGRYLRYGGLPYLARLPFDEMVYMGYLESIVDTVLLRDVVERAGVRNVPFMRSLTAYCADSIGSLLSAKRIADFLKSQYLPISPQVVLQYLSHLEAAFLVHRCRRFDIQGRRIFEIGEKIYFEDLGLRTALRGYRQADLGKILENAILLRLLQEDWKPHVGTLGDREIDFIATRGDRTIYVQVALSVAEESTRDREFGNLLRIPDNHPKFVVSMDPLRADERGVRHLSAREFLLGTDWE